MQRIIEKERVGEQFVDNLVIILLYNMVDGEMSLDHMTQETVIGEARQTYGLGEGGPLANRINGNAFLAVASTTRQS